MKRRCVLGVLKTSEGIRVRDSFLRWMYDRYEVMTVEQDPPGALFEYPAIKLAGSLAADLNDPVLYIHTKGAARINGAQPMVRGFWEMEFTKHRDTYFDMVSVGEKASASAPIVSSKNKICWFNAFVLNPALGALIRDHVKPSEDRMFFEQGMLKSLEEFGELDVRGMYDSDADTANDGWTSFLRIYSREIAKK